MKNKINLNQLQILKRKYTFLHFIRAVIGIVQEYHSVKLKRMVTVAQKSVLEFIYLNANLNKTPYQVQEM